MTSHERPAASSALGPMPRNRLLTTVDELVVRAPVNIIFDLARDVERWPEHLAHYRYVRFDDKADDGGGIVQMSANRPFGVLDWPTWWRSVMRVHGASQMAGSADAPAVRFRHIGGITTGMDVEWTFSPAADGTLVRIVHVWNGPRWPIIGKFAATAVIGPVFVHGIASRTLAGLGREAERRASAIRNGAA